MSSTIFLPNSVGTKPAPLQVPQAPSLLWITGIIAARSVTNWTQRLKRVESAQIKDDDIATPFIGNKQQSTSLIDLIEWSTNGDLSSRP